MKSETDHTPCRRIVHLVAQSHIDPAFMWEWSEGVHTILSTVEEAVRKMHRHDDLHFTRSGSLIYEWIKRLRPDIWQSIRQLTKQGRWAPVGGWYVQGDANLAGGESLIRQALIGQAFHAEHFGQTTDIGYLVDTFGFPQTFPKILAHCGYRYLVFSRPGETLKDLPAPVFRWTADDQSAITAYRVPVQYSTYADEPERISATLDSFGPQAREVMCFFGLGDHGGGPTEEQIQRVRAFAETADDLDIRFSDPIAFFAANEADGPTPPVFVGEMGPFAVGCYTAAAGLKRAHDQAERDLLDAEMYSVLAGLAGGTPPSADSLRSAWRDLLFAQFHDLLPGSGIKPALEHGLHCCHAAHTAADRAKVFALTDLANAVDTSQDALLHMVAFNPTNRAGPVYFEVEPWLYWQDWEKYQLLDDAGNPVPHQRLVSQAAHSPLTRILLRLDLSAGGYEHLRVVGPQPDLSALGAACKKQPRLEPRPIDQLNGGNWKLGFDRSTGTVSQIAETEGPLELTTPQLFDVLVFNDRSDTWTLQDDGYRDIAGPFTEPTVEQLEAGPLRWSARVRKQFGRSHLTQYIRTTDADSLITLHNQLDWAEPFALAKLVIPIPFDPARARRGIAFGEDRCPTGNLEFTFRDWLLIEPAEPTTTPLSALALLAGPGLHGADIVDRQLRITLVRSPVYCHQELDEPYEPQVTHEHMDLERHHSTIAIWPLQTLPSPAELTDQARELTTPSPILPCCANAGSLPPNGSLLSVEPPCVALTALKPAENGKGIIARLWNSSPTTQKTRLTVLGRTDVCTIPPHSLRTMHVLIEDAALQLNETNGIEQPGTF